MKKLVNPYIFPYAYIVKLKTYISENGSYNHGTGIIINQNSIITNAHNVKGKNFIQAISGYGGQDKSKIHNVSVRLVKNQNVFYPTEYDVNQNHFDYAVIKFDDKEMFNAILKQSSEKMFELKNINFKDLDRLHISGYPFYRWFERNNEDRTTGKLQVENSTTNKQLLNDNIVLQYKLDTRKGSSGSPLWIEQNEKNILIGIHKSGFLKKNEGILYNAKAIEQINKWISI